MKTPNLYSILIGQNDRVDNQQLREMKMTTPSKKAPAIETFLEDMFQRTTSITTNQCAGSLMGSCETPNFDWKDQVSIKEYSISG